MIQCDPEEDYGYPSLNFLDEVALISYHRRDGVHVARIGIDLNNFCRCLQSDVLINNRIDKGRKGRKFTTLKSDFAGDYATPEQRIDMQGQDHLLAPVDLAGRAT